VSRSATMVFDGRLPSKTRWGTSLSGVPSALTAPASAEGQRFGLANTFAISHVVVRPERVEGLRERDEVAGDEPGALVGSADRGVLAVGPLAHRWGPPARLIRHPPPRERDVLAAASMVSAAK